ncbi:MAG TPA: hypothetical protein PLZ43_14500, partial [bacterium]|nr:hypothetical protein [bacterium]
TAVCDFNNRPDDCLELNILRWFRDNWLINQHDGKELIEEYYRIAPKIVEKINNEKNHESIYKNIETVYINKCIKHIEQKEYFAAKMLYIEMVNHLIKLIKIL